MSKKKTVLTSLEDLGRVFRVKPEPKKPEKVRKCRKCGGTLHKVKGTNVYICDGINKENKKPFEHKVLSAKPATVA